MVSRSLCIVLLIVTHRIPQLSSLQSISGLFNLLPDTPGPFISLVRVSAFSLVTVFPSSLLPSFHFVSCSFSWSRSMSEEEK